MASKKTESAYPGRDSFRRSYTTADELLPVKNIVVGPNNTIQPPSYADRAYELCGPDGTEKYKKIKGWVVNVETPRILGKSKYHKEAFISQNQISSTPGYMSRNLDNGRNLKRKKG